MTNKPPPRDLWITLREGTFGSDICGLTTVCKEKVNDSIHYVEASHADTLQAELDAVKSKLERAESLLRELESKIVFNSENQSKIDRYFAEVESGK